MAEVGQSSYLSLPAEKLREKFLECPICFEDFTEEVKHPRLLPCFHTFCQECILKMVKNSSIQCPQCRSNHLLQSNDINVFPKDNTRRDLMDFVRVKKFPYQINCSFCNKTNVTVRCKQCAEFLCDVCRMAHQRTTMTRNHDLITMDDLLKAKSLEFFNHKQVCPSHPGKLLELYCAKDTCKKLICVVCAFVSCKEGQGHIIQNVEDVAEKERDNVRKQMIMLRQTRDRVDETCNLVEDEVTKIKRQEQYVRLEINVSFDNLIEILNRRRKFLLKDIKLRTENKLKILEEQNKELKILKSQMDEASNFCDQVLVHSNPSPFLQIEKTILIRLHNLINQTFDKAPYEHALFGFMQKGIATVINRNVNEITHLWNFPAYPPKTQISQEREAFANQPTTFHISIYGYDDKLLRDEKRSSEEYMRAFVTDPIGKETEYGINTRNGVDGEFVVTFVPFVSGEHIFEIRVMRKLIGQKKFTVQMDKSSAVSNIDGSLLENVTYAEFELNEPNAHKDVTVSPDGKTFLNLPSKIISNTSTKNRLQNYKGTFGSCAFKDKKIYFYKLNVRYKIKKPLQKCNLVFEIGLARQTSIDVTHHVEGQPYAWSMIGAHHTDCDTICLHIAHDNKCLFHQMLSNNTSGSILNLTFGFILDTGKGEWKIFNAGEGQQIHAVENVNTSEPLYPVVAGYNPNQVEVNIKLLTGSDIGKIP